MSEVTVGSLAKVLGMPVEKLLEQLAGAGMTFTGPDQVVSSTEKMKLLGFLRRTHGKEDKGAEDAAPKQITLKRRKQEELTVSAGKAKTTVSVEVRQKRTYVKRSVVEEEGASEREEAQRLLEESRQRQEQEESARRDADRKREEEEARKREAEQSEREQREAEEARARAEQEARTAAEQEEAREKARIEPRIEAKVAERPAKPKHKPARG
ncbi:MAG TPA: translation initiation factor IF-2 associated domain-containing protein, partial [Arenimonas sp.]|nr:translation initiation factor IF-2 associated domain-containing protein [Arenimonas sp.]